jgi:hypothetical protein
MDHVVVAGILNRRVVREILMWSRQASIRPDLAAFRITAKPQRKIMEDLQP